MSKKTAKPKGDDSALKTLKSVFEFMTQNGLDSVVITEDSAQIKLVRRKAQVTQVPVPISAMTTPATSASPAIVAAAPAAAIPAGTAVKSPMMGIFYRAPSPSSPPFCREGEAVKPGQVICMIEAMKVFNEIKADFPCTVVKYLVENGKPVKAGQDLIIVSR
jgi:acetyl-CoA carboxylase biotin carboxyl carrier protein